MESGEILISVECRGGSRTALSREEIKKMPVSSKQVAAWLATNMTGSSWRSRANQFADGRNFIQPVGVYALNRMSELGGLGKNKPE